MNVGFIGLGAMGSAIAARLLQNGHSVHVWNRSREAAERLQAGGATVAEHPGDAFAGDAVFTMLADDAALRAVFFNTDVLSRATPGLIHVCMSTISAEFARAFAQAHERHHVTYVAAPVFGRPDVVKAGKLNIVAAGPDAAIERVQPLLDAIGERTWRLGSNPVDAAIVKIAGNFLLACTIESLGEIVALAKNNGVDPAAMLGILTGTLFAAPAYKTYGDLIVNQRFQPAGFKLTLGFKDLKLALAAGESSHTPMPFTGVLRDAFVEAIAHGESDSDWSVLAKIAAQRAGLGD